MFVGSIDAVVDRRKPIVVGVRPALVVVDLQLQYIACCQEVDDNDDCPFWKKCHVPPTDNFW